ncbi:MAG: 4Fe-4S binding protein [Bacteroidota bacterium]|nr:4Fe-4S binding protein [Bacteroidota bacterium]
MKKIRLTVSLVFFVFIALIFVDFKDYLPSWSNKYILFLEFVPSFFKFLNLFSLGAIGFIVVLALTLLFGRVYCSSICPLGTLQDIIGWISKKINKNKRYKLLKPYKILRYSLLLLSILSVALGSMAVINLLDP